MLFHQVRWSLLSWLLMTPWIASFVLGATPPNIVVLFVDDLGYGDLSCYGHPTIMTPHIDALAQSGIRFTNWYSMSALCSPSRAALLTGRYPVRSGLAGPDWLGGVLTSSSPGGLPDNETTLATLLREARYRTHVVGKWHLGQQIQYLPRKRGFDSYFGIPFSNDMGASAWDPANEIGKPLGDCPTLPLLANETIIEQPVNLATLNERYTDEAIRVISSDSNDRLPFFLYLAYNHVHTPLFCSKEICGTSPRGLYGDSVLEIDTSVGRIIQTLEELKLRENTLIFFTSDNGPWIFRKLDGGSAGLFRDGKASTWEGGFRVPGIISWPSRIPAGVVSPSIVTTMDIFATSLSIAGVSPPSDRIIDSKDLSNLLFGKAKSSPWDNEPFFFYRGTPGENPIDQPGIWAIRKGPFKLHWVTKDTFGLTVFHNPPLLFNLDNDPSETYPLDTNEYADVVAELIQAQKNHEKTVIPVPTQKGSDPSLCLCCDPNSQIKYPEYPQCTCNPEYWTIPTFSLWRRTFR